MKANELTIGDWVKSRGKIEQVTSVYEGYICTDSYEDSHDYYFQPIPLTAEILEKNGFICKGAWMISGEDLGLKQCGDYFKLLPYYYDYNSTGMCDIYYVHELQHALRLCGIDKKIVL